MSAGATVASPCAVRGWRLKWRHASSDALSHWEVCHYHGQSQLSGDPAAGKSWGSQPSGASQMPARAVASKHGHSAVLARAREQSQLSFGSKLLALSAQGKYSQRLCFHLRHLGPYPRGSRRTTSGSTGRLAKERRDPELCCGVEYCEECYASERRAALDVHPVLPALRGNTPSKTKATMHLEHKPGETHGGGLGGRCRDRCPGPETRTAGERPDAYLFRCGAALAAGTPTRRPSGT